MMEKHLQTALAAILIGLVGWVGVTVSSTATEVAVLKQTVIVLTSTIEKLEARLEVMTDDRYRASDARRDLGRVYERLSDHEKRIGGLEGK